MLIESIVTRLTKGQATNSTATSFAVTDSRPTRTKPVASATRTIISWENIGVKDRNTLKLLPYGGNTDNDVVNVKVYGWNSHPDATNNPNLLLWVPRIVCEIQGTLSSALLGVAGTVVAATEFFCDTIALTTGIAVIHQGTADVDVAWAEMDVSSFELIEIRGDLGAGGDTQNWLYCWG